MITKAVEFFQYLRGAVRSAYGEETFRGKSILFIGMDKIGQDILLRLCLDGVSLFFADHRVSSYYQAHTVCGQVSPYQGEPVDITLDFESNTLTVNGKLHPLPKLDKESYIQGIHDFYL